MKWLLAAAILYGIWWFGQRKNTRPLSVREARDLLGLGAAASADDIRAAHHRLIARVHPDAGGSSALASRVNAARDVLVMELNRTRG